jgi:hypothetical protein
LGDSSFTKSAATATYFSLGWFFEYLEAGLRAMVQKVDEMLGDKRFFTLSDLLHFQRLGIVPRIAMSGHEGIDHTLSQLGLKLERLRELIALVQQRAK